MLAVRTISALVTSFLFLAVVTGFGTAFSLNAIAVSEIPPLWVAAFRATLAGFVFLSVVLVTGRSIKISRRSLTDYVVIGATTGAIPFFLLAWGQMIVPSSLAGVLFASVPLMTVFLSWLIFSGPRPLAGRSFGAVLGLIGVAIAFPSAASVSAEEIVGAASIMLAAVSYAFGGLFLQRASTHDPFSLMAGQFLLVALVLASIAISLRIPLGIPQVSPPYVAAATLGMTGSAVPLFCFLLLLRRTDPVVASSVTFFIPFVAVSIGIFILNESASPNLLLGFAICAAGSLLVLQPFASRSSKKEELL